MTAVQREFAWGYDRITKPVDRFMRRDPIGSLLRGVKLWTTQSCMFDEFLTNDHG